MGARELIGWCKKGERAGFDSVWISEDPYFRDAFSLIGLAASATKKVSVATGIVNVYTRSPVYMAMADFTGHRRFLHRTTVAGDAPIAAS